MRPPLLLFAGWLNGPLPGTLFAGPTGEELLTRLFVEASLKGHNGVPVPGSRLGGPEAAELVFGGSDSSEWTLRLSIEPVLVQAVLDALAARSPRLAAIVEAARS